MEEPWTFTVRPGPGYRVVADSTDRSWPSVGAVFEPGLPAGTHTRRLAERPHGVGTVEVLMSGKKIEAPTTVIVRLNSSDESSRRSGEITLEATDRARSNSVLVPGEYAVTAEMGGDPPFSMARAVALRNVVEVAEGEVTTLEVELVDAGLVRATISLADPNTESEFPGFADIECWNAEDEMWEEVSFGMRTKAGYWIRNRVVPGVELTSFGAMEPGTHRFRLSARGWVSDEVEVEVLTQVVTELNLQARKE